MWGPSRIQVIRGNFVPKLPVLTPNACLNCAHVRTDITFLDVHRAELRETERVIAKAAANGWTRQSEMNERKRTNLVNIITSLEEAHA
jgi:hypothetical protein